MTGSVLHLVHNFPPEFEGGTERYVSGLVRRQQESGWKVRVVCGSEQRRDAGGEQREDWHGVPVYRQFRRPDEHFGVLFHPRRIVERVAALAEDAQLIHLHHWFNLGDGLLRGLPDRPVVASFHDAYAACPRFFLLRPEGDWCGAVAPVALERCVACVGQDDGEAELPRRLRERREGFAAELARIDRALAPSEFHARLLERLGLFPASRVGALPLGLDLDEALPPARPSEDGRLRLLCMGNLSVLKGVELLLQAVAGLRGRERVELALYGRVLESDRRRLEAAAEGSEVRFHGAYRRADLGGVSADLAVLPSLAHETYSLVAEEARALGLPLVASDRGALPERVGAEGVCVSVDSPEPLRDLLQSFLDDPSRLRALPRPRPAEVFTQREHWTRLRALYESLISPS